MTKTANPTGCLDMPPNPAATRKANRTATGPGAKALARKSKASALVKEYLALLDRLGE
jgi:hypothetical protein